MPGPNSKGTNSDMHDWFLSKYQCLSDRINTKNHQTFQISDGQKWLWDSETLPKNKWIPVNIADIFMNIETCYFS